MSSARVLHKLSDKVKRKLSKHIWINRKYLPAGVASIDSASQHGMAFHEINPPYISALSLDQKFLDDCASNLRPNDTVQYPGDYIVAITAGRVYRYNDANMAVVTQDNFLVGELSFQWDRERKMLPGNENEIFRNRMFLRPKKFEGKVFSLLSGGGANTYYYHWLFDSMPKLALLHATGEFDEIDYFLVPNTEYKYQREYLSHFGIKEDRIIDGSKHRHIMAECLLVGSFTRVEEHLPRWICDFLHQSFILPSTNNKQDKLIYIGRGDALRNRRVLNEAALIKELLALGFEVYFLATLSVDEQAQLFNSSKIVIASHGGGLSNLVYCEPGTMVLEFFPDNYVNHLFYDLCTKRGLDYSYLICESSTNYSIDELQAETNTVADISAIVNEAKRMLAMI